MIREDELSGEQKEQLRENGELSWQLRVAEGEANLPPCDKYVEQHVKKVMQDGRIDDLANLSEEIDMQQRILRRRKLEAEWGASR